MIKENVKNLLNSLPEGVKLVVAAKTRTVEEINEAILGGASIIGENYVQEAKRKFDAVGSRVKWHLIGHLQKNKAKTAVRIFDMIETLDSWELAVVLNKECQKIGKQLPVLIEVNSASEPQKQGVFIDDVESLLKDILRLEYLKPCGLMTMGPNVSKQQDLKEYFKKTRELFFNIGRSNLELCDWRYLSMGMSGSYKIALEQGANIVRVGTAIFGERSLK
ncbi:MAG: YggS family pyridoxal phosphate-dependent enzyme [Candidatus Omnitrophica bacterium]|nr:YggS family pyridoxal phosphate-dependent enzyme [Candidatus Omnitrophota bacterium]MDD5430122.1 YggS family pyridoxal phosphate-dependent enzyme [Candidatus Omnitrophota bacterium]